MWIISQNDGVVNSDQSTHLMLLGSDLSPRTGILCRMASESGEEPVRYVLGNYATRTRAREVLANLVDALSDPGSRPYIMPEE